MSALLLPHSSASAHMHATCSSCQHMIVMGTQAVSRSALQLFLQHQTFSKQLLGGLEKV